MRYLRSHDFAFESEAAEHNRAGSSRLMVLRRVDWPLIIGKDVPAPRVARGTDGGGVASVLAMAEELSTYPHADIACRRAVELARDRIGLERTAIYLEDGEMMRGTWGTGARGETTDEHEFVFPVGGYEHSAHQLAVEGSERWLLLEDAPHIAHAGSEAIVLGYGWLAMTAIRSAGKRLGIMFSDGALSRAPFSRSQHVRLAVLCSLLGGILARHGTSLKSSRGAVRLGDGMHPTVRQALERIDEDLTRTTKDLATLTGASPRHLGRLFRREVGESLVSYRNRRRLDRFFALTDGTSENLLQAALAAGFGSNAQFHRVFKTMLGTTPGEYLTGTRSDLQEVERGQA